MIRYRLEEVRAVGNTIRILIADASRNYGEVLKTALESEGTCSVCAIARDGVSALALIRRQKPEIVLTELILPGMDGLELLDELAQGEYRPKVIVLSQWIEENLIQQALHKGARYFMAKPCSTKALLERIQMLARECVIEAVDPDLDAEMLIWEEMKKLGVSPVCKGFDMACDMLLTAVKDPDTLRAIGEKLYRPYLRDERDTVKRIEHDLRYLIETAWSAGDFEYQQKLFGNMVRKGKMAPTNGTFLAVVSRQVRMKLRLRKREHLSGSVNF